MSQEANKVMKEVKGSLSLFTDVAALTNTLTKVRFPNATEDSLDLLRRMLAFLPEERISLDEALRHRFFQAPCTPLHFGEITEANVRGLINKEVMEWTPLHFGEITEANVRDLINKEVMEW